MSNSEAADRTEALRVLHVAIDPPVGARLRSRLHAVRPAHGDWDIEALISAMSGESSSGHDLDRLLLCAQRRDPGIADELQVVHLARIINLGFEGSSRRSVHARAALIEAFGQPTPMELAAVADADGRPSAELPVVLGVLADESASLWSEADVRAYVHFGTTI
ncbi:MAG: hypothetical protein R2710_04080 [Acidimicrobiales bacterium]